MSGRGEEQRVRWLHCGRPWCGRVRFLAGRGSQCLRSTAWAATSAHTCVWPWGPRAGSAGEACCQVPEGLARAKKPFQVRGQ